jgi:hypothetical protein
MYSTCIFCHSALGTNDAIEHFPVGRRLAFDTARGRLWVVCRSCERWNLTPLEERWEAIEECERLFSGTKLRVSTDEIGLARTRDGTTLIRIGQPQRPEMAAWRYGDQFGRRRRRYLWWSGAGVAAVAGLVIAGPVTGLIGGAAVNLVNVGNLVRALRTVARVRTDRGVVRLDQRSLNTIVLRPNRASGFEMEIPYVYPWRDRLPFFGATGGLGFVRGSMTLRGDDALATARVLLPHVNAGGGNSSAVSAAVSILEADQSPTSLFTRFAAERDRSHRTIFREGLVSLGRGEPEHRLGGLSPAQRLALEMVLHEDDERRALEGELAELEERWRQAEEVASISDNLLVSPSVEERAANLKAESNRD